MGSGPAILRWVTGLKIGHARCSTNSQDPTVQHEALIGLGVPPDRVYVDHGLTGTNRSVPGGAGHGEGAGRRPAPGPRQGHPVPPDGRGGAGPPGRHGARRAVPDGQHFRSDLIIRTERRSCSAPDYIPGAAVRRSSPGARSNTPSWDTSGSPSRIAAAAIHRFPVVDLVTQRVPDLPAPLAQLS